MPLQVDVITPEKLVFSDSVDFISAPAADGEVGILPHHAPLLTKLGFGELRLKKGIDVKRMAVAGGFLEVQMGSHVSIFAETAELAEEIDAERARQAAERAQAKLKDPAVRRDMDLTQAELALNKALLRLKVAKVNQRHQAHRSEVH